MPSWRSRSSRRAIRRTIVTVLRVANAIGAEQRSSQLALLGLPVVPAIFGFDPRCQFIHEDDVVGVLEHAVRHDLPGTYNAAADGVLALSEIVSLLGKPMLPVLPPWGTGFAASQLRRLGLPVPVELLASAAVRARTRQPPPESHRLRVQLHEPRGGAEAEGPPAAATAAAKRGRVLPLRTRGRGVPALEPERPGVRGRTGEPPADGVDGGLISGYDELSADEVVGIIASLEPSALHRLRDYEVSNQARSAVLEALDRGLSRRGFPGAAS